MRILDKAQADALCPTASTGSRDMNYQGVVESVRALEDSFAILDGGWPGHHGLAHSMYPNLAAELAARGWQIGTPVEAAGVSRRVLAGVIEDGIQ